MAQMGKLAFTDAAILEERIEDYFATRWATRTIRQIAKDGSMIEFEEQYMRPPTLAGLARHLGVIRQTLWNYQKRGEGKPDDLFRPVILRALDRLAEFNEEALFTREGVTGAQFSLRVNHRYGAEDEGQEGSGGGFVQHVTAPAAIEDRRTVLRFGDQIEDAEIIEEDDE